MITPEKVFAQFNPPKEVKPIRADSAEEIKSALEAGRPVEIHHDIDSDDEDEEENETKPADDGDF